MSEGVSGRHREWLWPSIVGFAVIVICAIPVSGGTVAGHFFSSLRIAKPKPVAAGAPPAGTSGNRQLQQLVVGLLADTSTVTLDEPDIAVPTADSARRLAGFAPRLLATRSDAPSFSVIGAHAVRLTVNADQLQTNLREAGHPGASQPAAAQGATVTMNTPRAIRVQYGNCPLPVAATLQNQIQGPPPPSTDNGNCVTLIETPRPAVAMPAALDSRQLVGIALELGGMSPNQSRDFQQIFDPPSALGTSFPRNIRSYDTVRVAGTPAMLLNAGGRRGPTYALLWTDGGTVYTLAGYGSSADGLSLANAARR